VAGRREVDSVKKRSALTVAGGLVGALLSGVVGYSMRLAGVQAAGAAQAPPKPIVKTITTTVHVKKKPKVRHVRVAPAPVTVVHSSSSTKPPATSTGGSHSSHGDEGDDGGEHEGGDD
jgi:hypothetical protein